MHVHVKSIAESLYSLFTCKYMLKIITATQRLVFSKESTIFVIYQFNCLLQNMRRRSWFRGTPHFQIFPFLVNLLNYKAIFSALHGTVTKHWPWCFKSKNWWSQQSSFSLVRTNPGSWKISTRSHYGFQE